MYNPLVSHIGIAVSDLDAAIEKYRLLTGDQHPEICDVSDQKVKVAIFKSGPASGEHKGGRVELLAPTDPESPIAKFIAKRGEGLHHICIYVDNIREKLAELKNDGVELIDESPRRGAEGNLIAFVHPRSTGGVLIELEEIVSG